MKLLSMLDLAIAWLLRAIASALLACILSLIFYGIVARQIEGASISWADEIIEPAIAWMVFLSAAALWREKSLFTVNLLEDFLSARAALAVQGIIEVLCLIFAAAVLHESYKFTATSVEDSPFLDISKTYWYAAIPMASALMTAYSIRDLIKLLIYREIRRESTNPLVE